MKHEEILKTLWEERKNRGFTQEEIKEKAGTSALYSIYEVLRGAHSTVGLKYILQILDVMDLTLVIEDKEANWGDEMARLRMMPKKLFVGERIEAREIVRKEGFYPRVDLFSTPEEVLKFLPGNCDIYEIKLGRLIRKKFDVIEHPFGTMYSYNDWIPPEAIVTWVTHR